MPKSPVISVVTPTKNRRALLAEAIASVRAQTFPDWELLVVDDGSDDGTAGMVEEITRTDPRVRFLRREGERAGANVCRNLGIREARGEFLVFLDSDDLLTRNCLGTRIQTMERNRDLDFCVWQTGVFQKSPGDMTHEFSTGLLGDDLLRFLFLECPWQTSAPVWKKESLERLGGWDDELPSWQDVDLHIRALCGGLRYLRFSGVDHYMRWAWDPTKTSVLQRRCPDHLRAAESTLAKFEREVRKGPGLDWTRQRALCGLHFFLAERWVEIGELGEALRVWKSCRIRQQVPRTVHFAGSVLLLAKRCLGDNSTASRAINKWRGFVRMRINPELVAA